MDAELCSHSQATSDDNTAKIRVEYTPIRSDGVVGKTVVDEVGPITIGASPCAAAPSAFVVYSVSVFAAPRVVRQVKAYLMDEKAAFPVTALGEKNKPSNLKIKVRQRVVKGTGRLLRGS